MTYRHQIPATGWKAVIVPRDGFPYTIPLVCWEILCADEEDEDEFAGYEPETFYSIVGETRDRAKPKKGSAIEAVGLAFCGVAIHPQWEPTLGLSEAHSSHGFVGYLPPGEDLEKWLNDLPAKPPSETGGETSNQQ